jgi:hypothetical protein
MLNISACASKLWFNVCLYSWLCNLLIFTENTFLFDRNTHENLLNRTRIKWTERISTGILLFKDLIDHPPIAE